MRNEFFFLEYEISQIQKYLKFNNSAMKNYQGTFAQGVSDKSKDMPKSQKEAFLSYYADELSNMHFAHPSMFFSSFVVTWFSFVEVNLLEICKRLDLKATIEVKEKIDIREGIDRAWVFLRKGAEYDFEKDVWDEIIFIRKMRNIIVHNHGRIDYSNSKPEKKFENNFVKLKPFGDEIIYVQIDKNLFDYLKSYNLYDVFEYFEIHPSREYCQHLVDLAKELFNDLDKKLPHEKDEQKQANIMHNGL
jgi:hypothetical protein